MFLRVNMTTEWQCEVTQMVTKTFITSCSVKYDVHAAEDTKQGDTTQTKEVSMHVPRTAGLWWRKLKKTHLNGKIPRVCVAEELTP